jgi:hypothetical protein
MQSGLKKPPQVAFHKQEYPVLNSMKALMQLL